MPSPLTVELALDQFLASERVTSLPFEEREVLKSAFMDGLCSGVTLAMLAFEESKTPGQLQSKLSRIANAIDGIVPESQQMSFARGEDLATTPAKGNA